MSAAPSRGIHVPIMGFISLERQPCSVSPMLPQITLENCVKCRKLFGSNRGHGYRHTRSGLRSQRAEASVFLIDGFVHMC